MQDSQSTWTPYLQSAAGHGGTGFWSHHRFRWHQAIQLQRKVEGKRAVEVDDDVTQHSEDPSIWMGMDVESEGRVRKQSIPGNSCRAITIFDEWALPQIIEADNWLSETGFSTGSLCPQC